MPSTDHPPTRRGLAPVLISAGLLTALISSLGAPMVPALAEAHGVSVSAAQWSLTITMLVGAVATPVMGRLGDGPHRRTVFLCGLLLVLAGSVLPALPLGFPGLLTGRALQGVGIGLTPLAMSVARDALAPRRARSTLATLSVTAASGVGLGYPVTGWLADRLGAQAAFWPAAIATAVAFVAAYLVLPPPPPRPSHRLDLAGAALLATGTTGLLLTLTQSRSWGRLSPAALAVGAGSALLLLLWGRRTLRRDHPLVDLRLLKDRSVLVADLNGVLSGVALSMTFSLVTRYVLTPVETGYGFGASVLTAGLMLVPFAVGSLAAGQATRVAPRCLPLDRLLPAGCLLSLTGTVLFVMERNTLWQVVAAMAVIGLGTGIAMAVMPAMIVRAVAADGTTSALGVNQVLKYFGYALGSALSAVLLERGASSDGVPTDAAYTVAGLTACAMWAVSALAGPLLVRSPSPSGAGGPEPQDPGRATRTPGPHPLSAPTVHPPKN
ncbi:MFS transporter [Streptomyces atacamensis]|uniref:MFS transporter n=1 Tax=Streptomyces atacamensis TaxID=531966 RepID=UPI00399CC1F9